MKSQETKSRDKVAFDSHNDNLALKKFDSSPDTKLKGDLKK
jgi:hypothetical protein